MKNKIFTSLYLEVKLKNKLEQCAYMLDVDMTLLLSVLCCKAGKYICKKSQCFSAVEYQDRGEEYEIVPVYFFGSDHEYIHGCRLACKVSVSKILSCAMVMFLDEIMEKGINQGEIVKFRTKKNSYKKNCYCIRNLTLNITKNDKFDEYIMKMRMKKT